MTPLKLFIRLAIFSASALTTPQVNALTEIIADTEIGPETPDDEDYTVTNGATLTGNGSVSGRIQVGTNGSLNNGHLRLTNSSVVNGDISGYNSSSILIDRSIVNGSVSSFDQAELHLSNSTVSGAITVNTDTHGTAYNVTAGQIIALNAGSWTVTNSRIDNSSGAENGLGSGAGAGAGAQLARSSMSFAGSHISGVTGAVIYNGTLSQPPRRHKLSLDSTLIESTTGPVFQVGVLGERYDMYGNVDISLMNNSYARSDSGVLMDVVHHSDVTLSLDASRAQGDIIVDETSRAIIALANGSTLKGNLVNVQSLSLASKSQYEMTQNTGISSLVMSNSSVSFGSGSSGAFHTLTLGELEGYGDFYMRADVAGQTGDFLDVTSNANGYYVLHVANTGGEPVLTDDVLGLVRTGGGNADFSLYGGKVDIGAWQYSLVKNGNEWGLGQTGIPVTPIDPTDPVIPPERSTSASTDALLNMASANRFMFQAELDSIGGRLDTGRAARDSGVWGSYLNNSQRVQGAWNSAYNLQQNGFIVGGDLQTDIGQNTLISGAFVTQSDGKIKNARGGKSRVESWGVGLYMSLGLTDGWYTDVIMKVNRFSNDLSATMSDGAGVSGSWTSYGWGAALEGGRRIALASAPVSLTPYVSLSGYQNQDREVRLSNGMQARTGDGASLLLETGLRTAYETEVAGKAVMPYVNVAAQQELVTSSSVVINDQWNFSNDFKGTRARVGGGVNVAVTDTADVWAEVGYTSGRHLETPVNANVGVRVRF